MKINPLCTLQGANIFLTEELKTLKLGDFGCAVKIKAHTTMPGELQVNDVVVILMITVKIKAHSIVPRETKVIVM